MFCLDWLLYFNDRAPRMDFGELSGFRKTIDNIYSFLCRRNENWKRSNWWTAWVNYLINFNDELTFFCLWVNSEFRLIEYFCAQSWAGNDENAMFALPLYNQHKNSYRSFNANSYRCCYDVPVSILFILSRHLLILLLAFAAVFLTSHPSVKTCTTTVQVAGNISRHSDASKVKQFHVLSS